MNTLAESGKGEGDMKYTAQEVRDIATGKEQDPGKAIQMLMAYAEQIESADRALGERMLRGVRSVSMSYTPHGKAVDMRLEFDVTISSQEPEFQRAVDWINDFRMMHSHIA